MNKRKALLLILPLVFVFLTLLVIIRIKNESQQPIACNTNDFSGRLDYGEKIGFFEGENVNIPELAFATDETPVLGISSGEKWIDVDLSEQKLVAWEGDRVFMSTYISTGLPWWPTPEGEFYIWIKLRATKMEGGQGKYYYYLPNVPYVMFFENSEIPGYRGYGLHGTYWHNDFGRQRSHGCVNLPTEMAKRLYYWATPNISEGKWSAKSSDENPGTKIIIHQ